MLEHLGITRPDVLIVEGLEELCVQNDAVGIVENANLVLQSAEVDAGLSADTGIDHRQEGRRHIDKVQSALECRRSETAEVGDHAATEVDDAGMTRGTTLLQQASTR